MNKSLGPESMISGTVSWVEIFVEGQNFRRIGFPADCRIKVRFLKVLGL